MNFMLRFLFVAILYGACTVAHAHDRWANGNPIPKWVKSMCCGGNEAHDLTALNINWWIVPGGYKVDGFNKIIKEALPSQDGHAWAFYYYRDAEAPIYCLFVPMDW